MTEVKIRGKFTIIDIEDVLFHTQSLYLQVVKNDNGKYDLKSFDYRFGGDPIVKNLKRKVVDLNSINKCANEYGIQFVE